MSAVGAFAEVDPRAINFGHSPPPTFVSPRHPCGPVPYTCKSKLGILPGKDETWLILSARQWRGILATCIPDMAIFFTPGSPNFPIGHGSLTFRGTGTRVHGPGTL